MGLDCIRKVAEQASYTPFPGGLCVCFSFRFLPCVPVLISFSDGLGSISRSKPFPLPRCFLAIMAFITAKETKWGQKKLVLGSEILLWWTQLCCFGRRLWKDFWSFGLEKPWVIRMSREKQMEVLFVKLQRKVWDPPPRFYHECLCDILELRTCGSSWAWWCKTIIPAEDRRRQGPADLCEFQLGLHRQTSS